MKRRDERGFTIIELLVTVAVLSLVSAGFYQVLFAGQRSSEGTRDVVDISEEARLGLNRLLRDTREAQTITATSATEYSIRIDFDGDGDTVNDLASGDYENLTFQLSGRSILVSAPYGSGASSGVVTETLMDDVTCVQGAGGVCEPLFTYTSNLLQYDADGDGETSYAELQAAQAAGATDLAADLSTHITGVKFLFNVEKGGRTTTFRSSATLRNRRSA
jgi:prepilin-type N-terminal cleavage/methylation domain-containing protein